MKAKMSVPSVVLIALAGFAPPAFAYLDPSTGSMVLSAIVGVLATLGLAVKTYWYKLRSFFNSNRQTQLTGEAAVEQDEPGDNAN